MKRLLKNITIVGIFAVLSSCTCTTPIVITEIQKTDKKLSCKDVILEINEAEHYKSLAKDEEGIGVGEILMPVCWVTSYTDARKAVNAANRRIEYLGRIYDVMDCGGKSDAPVKSKNMTSPPFIQIQPVPAPKASVIPAPDAEKEDESGNEKEGK